MNNLAQFKEVQLSPEAMFSQVLYQRSLIGLGTVPADWQIGKMHESAKKDVVRLSFDDSQIIENTLADSVHRTFGITYGSEEVHIRPFLAKLIESDMKDGDFDKAIPMAITELNRLLDLHTWKVLKAKATQGNRHAWQGPADFISWALGLMADPVLSDLRKHLVITEKIKAALLGNIANPDNRSWYSALANRLAEVNCDVITAKAADNVLLVVEPFLIEYAGMEPHPYKSGVNEEGGYRWLTMGMSNTDFSVRDPLGLQHFEVTGVTRSKIRETAGGDERETTLGDKRAVKQVTKSEQEVK